MENYDVIVIGSGSGMIIASNAVASNLKTALIESGPIGGTCINRGCVPSKMLIYPADVTTMIRDAERVGVDATVASIDFKKIMNRMRKVITEDTAGQIKSIEKNPKITWFKEPGQFISDYTLRVGTHTIKGNRIYIASGARPTIPKIKGIETVNYLTSDTVLNLVAVPKSMLILGGGYVAVEYGHFFASLGTKVTIVQKNKRILPKEEPEISNLLKEELQKRMEIHTGHDPVEVTEANGTKTVTAKNLSTGQTIQFSAETLLVAVGRTPNSDILKPEKTGVELDKRGFIKVSESLETRKNNVYAFGDAIGKQMFKHVANFEAEVVWHNTIHSDHKIKMNYAAAPHAVFTHPQVASVGLREDEARQKHRKILVGKAFYRDTAQGTAMAENDGFVKVIVDGEKGRILGGHIIGPQASILIQEIVNAMASGDGTFRPIVTGLHIHPAMSEVVQIAFTNLKE